MMADDFGGFVEHETQKCDRIANSFLENIEKWEDLFTMVKNRGDQIVYAFLSFDNYSDCSTATLHSWTYQRATFLDELRFSGQIEKPGTKFFPAEKGRGWFCPDGEQDIELHFSPEKAIELRKVCQDWKEIKKDKQASLQEERARAERWSKLNHAHRMLD